MRVPWIAGMFLSLLLMLMFIVEFEAAESVVKQAVFGSFRLSDEFKSADESPLCLVESLVTST